MDEIYNQNRNNFESWDMECEALGKKKDCGLPSWNAERWDKKLQDRREVCFKKYPQD